MVGLDLTRTRCAAKEGRLERVDLLELDVETVTDERRQGASFVEHVKTLEVASTSWIVVGGWYSKHSMLPTPSTVAASTEVGRGEHTDAGPGYVEYAVWCSGGQRQ